MSRIKKLREPAHQRKHKLSELSPDMQRRVLARAAKMVEQWERQHGQRCRQPMRAILMSTAMRVESDPNLARRQAGRKSWRVRVETDEAKALQHMNSISQIGVQARRFQCGTGRRYKKGWNNLNERADQRKSPHAHAVMRAQERTPGDEGRAAIQANRRGRDRDMEKGSAGRCGQTNLDGI